MKRIFQTVRRAVHKMSFPKLIKEIDFTFNLIIFFFVLIRTCIVFIISFLVITVFIPQWWLAFIPAIIYFAREKKSKGKINKLREIEKKYPALQDRLRTAKDNPDEGNVFIFDLHKEVLEKIREVNSSTFFNKKRAKNDIILLCTIALITILIAPWNIHLFDFSLDPSDLSNFNLRDLFDRNRKNNGLAEEEGGLGVNEDIFGDKSVANLGNKELELTISAGSSDIDIREVRETEDLGFEALYPEDLGATASASFEEQIKKEDQEIVKNYYKNIAGNG